MKKSLATKSCFADNLTMEHLKPVKHKKDLEVQIKKTTFLTRCFTFLLLVTLLVLIYCVILFNMM